MSTQEPQQGSQVRRSVAVNRVIQFAQMVKQAQQLLLHRAGPDGFIGLHRIEALQLYEKGGEQQALLCLPHIFLGVSLGETMLYQSIKAVLLDFVTGRSHEVSCHILQYDRLQGETARTFPWLDQGAAAQAVYGFEHLTAREGEDQHCQ